MPLFTSDTTRISHRVFRTAGATAADHNVCPIIQKVTVLYLSFPNPEWSSDGGKQCLQWPCLDYSSWGSTSQKDSDVLKL
jgi:hypothetical protein